MFSAFPSRYFRPWLLLAALFPAGCLFQSDDPPPERRFSTALLDTIYPASAKPDLKIGLYLPILDAFVPPGKSAPPELLPAVNVREQSGRIVQYRLTKQRFGSWSNDLEFKWNYFLLSSMFLFPDSLPDTVGMESKTDTLYHNVLKTDAFTRYFDSLAAKSVWDQINTSTHPAAMGIEVKLSAGGDTIFVKRVVPDSPADRAGVVPGMAVLAIDDSALVGDSAIHRFTRFAPGDSGTSVTLTVSGTGGTKKATMKREPVSFPTVSVDSLPGAGYISISSFTTVTVNNKSTHGEFVDALKATRGQAVTILDLRDNPGGVLDLAIRMIDEIVPLGNVLIREKQRVYNEEKRAPLVSNKTYYATSNGVGENRAGGGKRQFILLSNGGSASAAEIFLVAVREALKAPIMGGKSYGKAVGQLPKQTPGKGLALITFLQFTSKSGLEYHKVGLKPDHPDSSSEDSLLLHAAELARTMAPAAAKKSGAGETVGARHGEVARAKVIEWNRRQAIRRGEEVN